MDKLKIFSPAKINLYLKITGKRPDGYHELKTLFQAVDLFDDILLEKTGSAIDVSCDDPSIPGGEKNVVYKAAKLLLAGRPGTGVKIQIIKRIPALAGLGGGSGNAAFALRGLDTLFGLNSGLETLKNIALQCGADVPFFLQPGRAIGEGIGDRLTKVTSPEELFLVLVNPGINKPSTKDIYSKFRFELTKSGALDNNILLNSSNELLGRILFNDLEIAAANIYPVILNIKEDLLKAGAAGALMSGSGLTVFGIAESFSKAKEITARMSDKYPWARQVKSFSG